MTLDDDSRQPEPLDTDRLTWAVLLARWTDFARGAVALPEAGEPGLVKRSVADIIALQAVWFSLQQMDELSEDERAIGLDRAGVLIRRHRDAIRTRFGDAVIPEDLASLIHDVEELYEKNT
jgi:hypothetical protein